MGSNEKKSLANMDIKDILKQLKGKSKKSKEKPVKNKKRNVVAFDIGTTTIKIAEGTYYKDKLTIDNLVKIATPANSVAEGEINVRDAVATMIGAALRQYNIKAKDAICTTNPTAIINREISIPKVDEDEIETVARYEIQQYLPINLDDCILQMQILNEFKDEFEEKEKYNVRVIVYPKRVAVEYYNLLSELNLKPYALDVNFNALNKLVNYTHMNKNEEENNKSIALLDMGADFIDVNIFKNNNLDFTRRIKAGGNDIDGYLVNDGGFEEKEATNVKINNIDLANDDIEKKFESKIVTDALNEWMEKIMMILQFYKNRNVGNEIDEIFIFGGSSNFKGLEEYITEKLGIKATLIRSLSEVVLKKPHINSGSINDYVNVIGSIIRL